VILSRVILSKIIISEVITTKVIISKVIISEVIISEVTKIIVMVSKLTVFFNLLDAQVFSLGGTSKLTGSSATSPTWYQQKTVSLQLIFWPNNMQCLYIGIIYSLS
jgi:hypothetical protein